MYNARCIRFPPSPPEHICLEMLRAIVMGVQREKDKTNINSSFLKKNFVLKNVINYDLVAMKNTKPIPYTVLEV